MPSEKLVRVYIEMGGDPGRLLGLFDRTRAARARPEDPRIDCELCSPDSDPYILRRGYTIESASDTHRFGAGHRLLSMSHRTVIHPVHDEARYFPIRYSYQDDPRPGVALIEGAEGCSVALSEEDPVGVVYAVLDFTKAQRDSIGAVEVAWTIEVVSSVPSRPNASAGTSTRLPVATVAVEFLDDPPSAVWPFRGFDERAGLRPSKSSPSALSDGRHEFTFQDLEREWWGLGWSWPAP
jgi:hypothetical protein